MSAFIVISLNDSLNWIVDGIKDCRPHNPDVLTHLSTGKIKHQKGDHYEYEYTTFSKHENGEAGDGKVLKPTITEGLPRELFANQISHFLNVCENEGEQINIFALDNPMTDEDYAQSSWLIDEIKSVYKAKLVTNFQLVRVLFSYKIDEPANVTRQASGMILKHLTNTIVEEKEGVLTRILYIDNQNRNGASICLDKIEHDIMMPRMLCDLMMLLSSKDDSYNTISSISSDTNMFAVGYSECMYYHDDVFRYCDKAIRRDFLKHLLDNANTEDSLDFNKYPIGMRERAGRLAKVYDAIPFDSLIDTKLGSVDKTIDDIVVKYKDLIIAAKEQKLKEAIEEDMLATEVCRQKRLEELRGETGEDDVVPETPVVAVEEKKGCNFFARWFHKEEVPVVAPVKPVDPRVADVIVTDAQDLVNAQYPDYIDRNSIYQESLQQKAEKEFFEGTPIEENVAKYESLIKFIQGKKFSDYLKLNCPEERISILMEISQIKEKREERKAFETLKQKVNVIGKELDSLDKELEDFTLSTHCTSVDSLVDLDALKNHFASETNKRNNDVMKLWENHSEEDRSLDKIYEDLAETIKWAKYGLYYVNWDEPFPFIKNIDLSEVCEHMKLKSVPFVHTYTLGKNAENLTTKTVYSDNPAWHEVFDKEGVKIKNEILNSCTLSKHVCSKICMFQFLLMSRELIQGLVDCLDEE